MKMNVEFEYELNREWICDDDGEAVGETNFVVPADWLAKLYDEKFSEQYGSFDDFMDAYEPEVDGEFIYQAAIKDGVLKEDLGIVMY